MKSKELQQLETKLLTIETVNEVRFFTSSDGLTITFFVVGDGMKRTTRINDQAREICKGIAVCSWAFLPQSQLPQQ